MPTLDDVLARIDDWAPETVAAGVTDAESSLAVHGPVDTVLPLASVTKPLAAYGVLVAIHHGLVHLDEPAGPQEGDGVTVRHLLAHAGGLPIDPQGVVNRPGERRIYSNWGYDLLGELVADRAGTAFGEFLDDEVLAPLGMDATVLEGSPARDATGSVTDLLAFGRELLSPRLIAEDLHADATSTAFPGLDGVLPGFGRQRPNDWGLGFEMLSGKQPHWSGPTLSESSFGHFGQSGSMLWVDPLRGIACASIADEPFGDWARQAWPAFTDSVVAAYAA